MITIIPGEPRPPQYVNTVVLTARFMHGDADMYTTAALSASADDQAGLTDIKRVHDFYVSLTPRVYPHATYRTLPVPTRVPNTDWNLGREDEDDEEAGITVPGDAVLVMFPWDSTLEQISTYRRATLTGFELTYHDAAGAPHELTLEETP